MCMYIHPYTHISIYKCRTHLHPCVQIHTCTHICKDTDAQTQTHTSVHINTCTDAHPHIDMHSLGMQTAGRMAQA